MVSQTPHFYWSLAQKPLPVVVLMNKILLRRGGILNFAFKHRLSTEGCFRKNTRISFFNYEILYNLTIETLQPVWWEDPSDSRMPATLSN